MAKPIYIKVEKMIHQPKMLVWKTVAEDFGGVSNYNPNIKHSTFIGQKREGIGTARHCDFQKKGWIEEEIIDWNSGHSFKLRFTKASMPMKHMESLFSFEESDHGSKITQEFWYRMGGPMSFLSGLMKNSMKKMLEDGLQGLENHLTLK